jgi:hypothetical protein
MSFLCRENMLSAQICILAAPLQLYSSQMALVRTLTTDSDAEAWARESLQIALGLGKIQQLCNMRSPHHNYTRSMLLATRNPDTNPLKRAGLLVEQRRYP